MYGEGKIEVIELEFTPNVYSNMIDKFGKDIHPKKINENLYCVQVRHIMNSTFFHGSSVLVDVFKFRIMMYIKNNLKTF